jgi:hypothetical protein
VRSLTVARIPRCRLHGRYADFAVASLQIHWHSPTRWLIAVIHGHLPTLRACQVFHTQDTRRRGSTPVPAPCSEQYLPGLTRSALPREGMEHCTERAPNPTSSTQESGMSLRRLLRPFMSYRFRVPATRSDPRLLFWIPINRQLSGWSPDAVRELAPEGPAE